MAADSWAHCPKCTEQREKDEEKERLEKEQKLKEAYGNVPADEYVKLVASFEKTEREKEEPVETLAEYHEFYLNGTTLEYDYYCKCSECGFEYRFDDKREIYP